MGYIGENKQIFSLKGGKIMIADINNIFSDIIIPSVSSALTLLATLYLFNKNHNKELARERLDKVLFPLIDILEPVLYKISDDEKFKLLMAKSKLILEQYKMLAGHKLYEAFHDFECVDANDKKYKQECFQLFSNRLIEEYNFSCRKVGLSGMSVLYRFYHRLFTTKRFIIVLAGYTLLELLKVACYLFVFLVLFTILLQLTGQI